MKNTSSTNAGKSALAVSANHTATYAEPFPETGKCCLCGGQYIQYGTNPFPMNTSETARSCHECDKLIVIPARCTDPATVKRIIRDAKQQGLTISEFLGKLPLVPRSVN